MTDQVVNRSPNRLGPPEGCLIAQPVGPLGLNTQAPSTTIYAGALCGYNASGQIDNIDGAGIVTVAGVCLAYTSNVATAPVGIGAPDGVQLGKGAYPFLGDGSVSGTTKYGTDLYAVDNQTLSTSDGNGTRVRAGFFECMDPSNTVNVICQVGQASPLATAPSSGSASPANRVRNVVTSLATYTGTATATLTASANGAWAAQDGVTNAAGDVVLVQAGTTNLTGAVDSGPWVLTSLGGAGSKWTLQRPDWWTNGSAMTLSSVIDVGPEGTLLSGTSWRSFAIPGSAVVGTNDPALYVGRVTQQVTLTASGNKAIANVGLRSLTATQVIAEKVTNGGTITSTIRYEPAPGATPWTIGYVGTATVTVQASVAAGTANAADQSVVNVTIINW